MAERQAAHRQSTEAKVISQSLAHEKIGLFFGFLVIVFTLCAGVYLTINDKSLEGIGTLITGVVLMWKGVSRADRKDEEKG